MHPSLVVLVVALLGMVLSQQEFGRNVSAAWVGTVRQGESSMKFPTLTYSYGDNGATEFTVTCTESTNYPYIAIGQVFNTTAPRQVLILI